VPEQKRILILCDHYLPSVKGGGGTWSVVNLVARFTDRFDFYVITRNHPSRTDRKPFDSVKANEWNSVGSAKVYYLAPTQLNAKTIASLVAQVSPDGVFLNSVFSKPSVNFLIARRLNLFGRVPVLLAPCGELTKGALGQKRLKKMVFLKLSKLVGLHQSIVWKATSSTEESQIRTIFGRSSSVVIAPDLPPSEILPEFSVSEKPAKLAGALKLIYYSRIDRMKNLKFLLQVLSSIQHVHIELTIAGQVDDPGYWKECMTAVNALPDSISISIKGGVTYNEGLELLKSSHVFALPTLGENFGYVIVEAMAAGCPIIISERTIWDAVQATGAGWAINLSDPHEWASVLTRCADLDSTRFTIISERARRFALDWIQDPSVEAANLRALENTFNEVRVQ